jgi:thiol-disulfide isomerase/thioredoxin
MLAVVVIACGGAGDGKTGDVNEPTGAAPIDAAPPELGVPFGPEGVDARLVNEPGKLVPLDQIVRPGRVTIIDFWAAWCGACKVMEEKLFDEIAGVPGIVVRKLDIVDDVSEVSVHFQVGRSLPEMWIFDKNGERVHQLDGGEVANAGKLAKELAAQ